MGWLGSGRDGVPVRLIGHWVGENGVSQQYKSLGITWTNVLPYFNAHFVVLAGTRVQVVKFQGCGVQILTTDSLLISTLMNERP